MGRHRRTRHTGWEKTQLLYYGYVTAPAGCRLPQVQKAQKDGYMTATAAYGSLPKNLGEASE